MEAVAMGAFAHSGNPLGLYLATGVLPISLWACVLQHDLLEGHRGWHLAQRLACPSTSQALFYLPLHFGASPAELCRGCPLCPTESLPPKSCHSVQPSGEGRREP